MHPHIHDIKPGQRVTVIYHHLFESRLVVGTFIRHAHDTVAVQGDGRDHAIIIAVCDLISIGRHAAPATEQSPYP